MFEFTEEQKFLTKNYQTYLEMRNVNDQIEEEYGEFLAESLIKKIESSSIGKNWNFDEEEEDDENGFRICLYKKEWGNILYIWIGYFGMSLLSDDEFCVTICTVPNKGNKVHLEKKYQIKDFFNNKKGELEKLGFKEPDDEDELLTFFPVTIDEETFIDSKKCLETIFEPIKIIVNWLEKYDNDLTFLASSL